MIGRDAGAPVAVDTGTGTGWPFANGAVGETTCGRGAAGAAVAAAGVDAGGRAAVVTITGGAGWPGTVDAGVAATGIAAGALDAVGVFGAVDNGPTGALPAPACNTTAISIGGGNTIGSGVTGAACGWPTMASCGLAPPIITCNCNVVPAGRFCGSCALTTMSPMRIAVMPSALRPSTIASSTCPGVNTGKDAAAARATTP